MPAYTQVSPQVEPPYFKGTSVDLNNQKINIYWDLSKTPQTQVSGYTIYQRTLDATQNQITLSIGSAGSNTVHYQHQVLQYVKSHKYTLRSHGFGGNNNTDSPQTDFLNTLFLQSPDFQECNAAIVLRWNNLEKFDKFKPENIVDGLNVRYAVWYAVDVPEVALTLSDFKLSESQLLNTEYTFTITPSVKQYHFFVRAYYDNGNGRIDSSQSNRISQVIDVERLPDYLVIDSTIHTPPQTQLYFQIDPKTTYQKFELQYRSGGQDFTTLKTIDNLTDKTFQDNQPLPVSYRIVVKNKCDALVAQSNTTTLIYPTIKAIPEGFSIHISPNICPDDGLFTIYRTAPYPTLLASNISDTVYIDAINGGQYEDYILTSNYDVSCANSTYFTTIKNNVIEIQSQFYMPNALRIDDPELNPITKKTRGIFEPVTPIKHTFKLTIYDTYGNLCFNGIEGWNGRKNNTDFIVQEGVYFYAVAVIFSNGEIQQKKGSVTVLY